MDRDNKIRDAEGIDIICAEIPDHAVYPDLYEVVIGNFMHGPCSPTQVDSPSMKDGKCSSMGIL